ncbi:hypothetical protein CHRYSEOSP005_15940 [Chryseobacterium sp. Alg-005]|uniref:hypothetical protein n=1 Tax=Chryseobacterium sp. Alg-005 TaxID=3159516 RepID=UPI0035558A8F
MSEFCTPLPENKKQYIGDIGKILVDDYGKKEYYKPEEIKNANKKSRWYKGTDYSCWSMSVFSSHDDFDAYHKSTGEICDYVEMKQAMLSGISADSLDFESLDVSGADIDIDSSWLDFGAFFEAIGDFFSSFSN